MAKPTDVTVDPGAFLKALQDPGRNLKNKYEGRPIELAERFGLKFPEKPAQVMERLGIYDEEYYGPIVPGIRELILDTCLGEVFSAVALGPRGGGKSQGVSFIEFYLWIIKDYDALNLGGSELQAANVYDYLISYLESDQYWLSLIKGETKISESKTIMDAWIRVLTASSKSVRSPHAGGWKRRTKRWAGGLLVIDEEAECDPEIVEASLYTINTARPSVNVRCSTFHNAEGTFADLIDNHKTMGFKLYQWDAIDVCAGCECKGGPTDCQNPEPCFREDHFEEVMNPETGQLENKLLHKAYCGGKAKYADGWIPMTEIINTWTRSKRNHAKFEVEAMGSRPSTSGFVIKDRKAYSLNVTPKSPEALFLPGSPVSINVDWGAVAAGLSAWQEQPGDRHVLLHAELVEEAGTTEMMGKILTLWNKYINEVVEVAADIGGGGNYNNPVLRDEHGLIVRDVNFSEEKEAGVAAWNIYNEAHKLDYPAEFETFHTQLKNWKRKNGRIAKGNDHIMDSCICYFSKFIDRLGLTNIRIMPRTTSTGPDPTRGVVEETLTPVAVGGPGRVAIARGLSSNSRGRSRR